MGSIASVLQWHCSECYLINPTEATKCARCGITRIESDEKNAASNLHLESLRDSLTQCQSDPRIEPSRSCSSSGSSTPPTPPPRNHSTCQNFFDRYPAESDASATAKDKRDFEDVQLPPVPPLKQNHCGTFIVLR